MCATLSSIHWGTKKNKTGKKPPCRDTLKSCVGGGGFGTVQEAFEVTSAGKGGGSGHRRQQLPWMEELPLMWGLRPVFWAPPGHPLQGGRGAWGVGAEPAQPRVCGKRSLCWLP